MFHVHPGDLQHPSQENEEGKESGIPGSGTSSYGTAGTQEGGIGGDGCTMALQRVEVLLPPPERGRRSQLAPAVRRAIGKLLAACGLPSALREEEGVEPHSSLLEFLPDAAEQARTAKGWELWARGKGVGCPCIMPRPPTNLLLATAWACHAVLGRLQPHLEPSHVFVRLQPHLDPSHVPLLCSPSACGCASAIRAWRLGHCRGADVPAAPRAPNRRASASQGWWQRRCVQPTCEARCALGVASWRRSQTRRCPASARWSCLR